MPPQHHPVTKIRFLYGSPGGHRSIGSYLSPDACHFNNPHHPSPQWFAGTYSLKKWVLSMSLQGLSDLEVCGFTGISEQSLKCLRSTYWNTGGVSCESPGWFHMLTVIEAKVRRNILSSWMVINTSFQCNSSSCQQVAYCTRAQAILRPPTSPERPPVTPSSQYNLFLYSLHNTSRFVELDQCVVISWKGSRKGSCSAPSPASST